uniref:ATP-dependent RNA helicase TDRD9 n=1 Tax=Sparus aurata TaxID=8175 RepID=A0A671WK84_SPAAU
MVQMAKWVSTVHMCLLLFYVCACVCCFQLISLIENNSVVIVRGATGSGKTTQLPQYILDHYNEKNNFCNIVVTQPRKIGATSIAQYVATQRKCTLGSLVGYQIGMEKIATENTRLIYMTTELLLQKLVQDKCLTEYTHIFVDEVHERTEEMDLLLLVLRNLLNSNSPYVKIILMSATINCSQFAQYFASLVRGKMSPAYVFEVEGSPYAVEEFYQDDLHRLFPCRLELPHIDDPNIPVEMYNLAVSLIQSFDEMEGGMTSSERGSVLVFLPGIHEIRCMQEALSKLVHRRLQIYLLHSTVILEEQNGVFQLPVPGYRKVILSTNIAESSLTVPDVKYVIDFCLARHNVCDPDTNYQSLRLTWASKTNCNQRRGRAGRVSKGYCYRLVTKEFWENEIPDYMIPEMQLAPLTKIMLKVKLLDMGDPYSVLSTALSPPNLGNIVRTVLQLKEMGALSTKSDGKDQNNDGELTFLGRVLAHLPVDIYLGKLIVLGHTFGCLDECLIIAAAQSLKSFFAIPSMQQLVAELYEDLKKRVSRFNMHVPEEPQSLDYTNTHLQKFILQVVIAGAYYPNYFVQQDIDEDMATKELSGHNPRTTVMVRNLPPYSFLYYKQLQSLFRLCGQVKAIFFDSSRAYVEFYRTSKESGVLPEVSLALHLAQQSRSMELSVYPTEQIENAAGNRSLTHMKHGRCDVGHFWGFQADEASLEKQRHLTAEINKRTLHPVTVMLYPNLLCLAPYSEVNDQSLYYRAKILHIRGNKVEVFFLDFGNTEVVASSSLREIPSEFLSYPFQAKEFQVAGLRPSAQSIILGSQWSSQARNCFITLVKDRSLLVSLYSIQHGIRRVQVLINTETKNTSVVDILVQKGHAVKAEEGLDSKMLWLAAVSSKINHEIRLRGPNNIKVANAPHPPSSFLMGVCSSCRTVSINSSISSLAMNENPHYKHQRMLVAGNVSVNATGSHILLKDTSFMPDIPGLPALVTMLFTPIMELRSVKRTCYTGALCGLGWNSQSQEGILPEHDIELTFDVKFDVEDITEINALRVAANRILCEGAGGTLHQWPAEMVKLQEDCRDRLTR